MWFVEAKKEAVITLHGDQISEILPYENLANSTSRDQVTVS